MTTASPYYPDAATRHLLSRFSLTPAHHVDHSMRASHISRRRGEGIEFHQFRPYQQGDDLRRVDWRLYGRSEKLFVREAEQESRLTVTILVDTSGSMALSDTDGLSRLELARRLAGCLGWLAMTHQYEFALVGMGGGRPLVLPPGQGVAHFERLLRHLPDLLAKGQWTSMVAEQVFQRLPDRMMLFVLGDFFEMQREQSAAIAEFTARAHTATLTQLLLPRELEFRERGQIEVVDRETGDSRLVSARSFRPQYLQSMQALLDDTQQRFLAMGARFCRASTATPLDAILNATLAPSMMPAARLLVDMQQ